MKHFGAVHPAGGFDWDDIFSQIRATPRRFDVSVWDGQVLCGMAAGMASYGKENVTLRFVERFDVDSNHLKGFVLETAITAAEHFAKIIGRSILYVKSPLPGTEGIYESLGFSLASRRCGGIYYGRKVA